MGLFSQGGDAVLAPIRESGFLRLTGAFGDHAVPAPAITADVQEAVEGADVLVVAVPAFAQDMFAVACAPFLRADQIVVLTPWSTATSGPRTASGPATSRKTCRTG